MNWTPEEENFTLRRLLFQEHPCQEKYGDDGQMQCNACVIDFRRDAVDRIEHALFVRGAKEQELQSAEVMALAAQMPVDVLKELREVSRLAGRIVNATEFLDLMQALLDSVEATDPDRHMPARALVSRAAIDNLRGWLVARMTVEPPPT
jgi:hypothetical protein